MSAADLTQSSPEKPVRIDPTFVYGFSSNIKGGAHFVDDETIVYPIGRVLAFHNIEKNTQAYVKVKGTFKINAVAISPNRKVIAVAIIGPIPAISFYDTTTRQRLMTVGNPAEGFKVRMFELMAFTQDSTYLIAVSSEPEGLLIYYKWATGGVVAHTKADGKISTVSSPITVVAPHPVDSSILAIGGQGVFRLMTLYYNEWRQYGFKRAEYWSILGVCWITPQLVLVGTKDGRLMVIEDTLVKGEFRVTDCNEIRVSERDDSRKPVITDTDYKAERDTSNEVRGLTAFSQGFAFAHVSGEVCVFQKVGKRHWIKKNVIATGAPTFWEESNALVNYVKHINISRSEKLLLCSSSAQEIYYTTIFKEQDHKFKVKHNFQLIHDGYHHGPVTTISACLYKPLFLTVGESDRTCRIWNFETLKLTNSITFSEEIRTAAFHPSGWYCSIAFNASVVVYMLLMESMKPIATIPAQACSIICYSKRGNMFALLNGPSETHVYAATTFEKFHEFQCPGIVSNIHFSSDDFVLFIGGLDGKIFKFCLKTGKSLFTYDMHSSVVHDMTSSSDGKMLYVVGTDGCLKVYRTVKTAEYDAGLVASHHLNQSVLCSVKMACDDTVLLVGARSSHIVSIQLPVTDKNITTSVFKLHSNAVAKLEITHVNPTLLSLGHHDGVVGIWNLLNLKKKPTFLKYYREVDEVIVNAENWSNKRDIIKKQQEEMTKLDRDYDEKLKLIEGERAEQRAKIEGRYNGVLEIIQLNNRISQEKNAAEIDKMTVVNAELQKNQEKELDEQRAKFEQRLRTEQEDLEQWRIGWDNIKYGFDGLINSVKAAGMCIAKRLEYFSALELTRRANETLQLKDDIIQIIEEQKNRELNLIKNSQFEIDELVENSDRHEQLAVEIIQLRSQKQKLSEQVEGLESTYYNMQEFLREAQKTIVHLDQRKAQRHQLETKQKKIQEKLQSIQESGQDILDNIDVSKSYHIHHMVSEECISNLCQITHLLEERKNLKRKEAWLQSELNDSKRKLTKLKYVLSFLSLQNYLHNNALNKNLKREKDKNRKMHFFKTNLKKEIHSMMCGADYGNLKGRLINLCSQYADPKTDFFELLGKLAGNKELWKAITHLEATKLHFGNCVSRLKTARDRKLSRQITKGNERTWDDDVDEDKTSESSSASRTKDEQAKEREPSTDPVDVPSTLQSSAKKKELEFDPYIDHSSTSDDQYHTSDEESDATCGATPDEDDQAVKSAKDKPVLLKKTPHAIVLNKTKTEKARAQLYGSLLEEKKLMVARLNDAKKRITHRKKMEKFKRHTDKYGGGTSERGAYKKLYHRIPMNMIIKALNKEIERWAVKPEMRQLVQDVFPDMTPSRAEGPAQQSGGHLCSLCKGYEVFTKYFEKNEGTATSPTATSPPSGQQRLSKPCMETPPLKASFT